MVGGAERKREAQGDRGCYRPALATLIAALGIAGLALLAKGLYPVDLPSASNPNFVDNVFDNRAVIWAARLLLISAAAVLAFGGLFIVISTAVRIRNGEWLRKAGPFEISGVDVGRAESRVDSWRQATLAAKEEIAELNERLARAERLARHFRNPPNDD